MRRIMHAIIFLISSASATRSRCIIPQYAEEDTAYPDPAVGGIAALRTEWLVSTVRAGEAGCPQGPAVGGRSCQGHCRGVDPAGGNAGALRQGAGTRKIHSS